MKIKAHRYLFYALFTILAFICRRLPLKWSVNLGAWLGGACFYLVRHERNKTIRHLSLAFKGEKSEAELKKIARGTFSNLGRNAGEWLKLPALNDAQVIAAVEVKNRQVIEQVLSRGKGLIMLTGHFGNWEWLAAFMGSLGYDGGVLARRIYFEPYNRFLVNMRLSHHIKTFYRDDSPKKILKVLADNLVMGILPDQDVDKINGIFIPFFGKQAYTPTAPVALARASGALIVPAFMIREKNKFKFLIEEPIEVVKTKNKEEDLKKYTKQWSDLLEKYIRNYPDHWVWMHRRWKTQPEWVKNEV